jgi:PKD repeat protein
VLSSLFRPGFNLSRWLALLLTLLGLSVSSPALAQQSASFTVSPTQVSVGQTVSALYRTQGGFDTLVLDWGDGTRDPLDASNGTATHQYAAPKTYTVLLVLDGKPFDKAQVTVSEVTACTIDANPNPAQPGETVALSVQFSGPINSKFGIDFGDGSVDNFGGPGPDKSISFKHAYKEPGTLIAVVSDLASAKPLCRLVVTIKPPVVEATTCEILAEPNPATVGESVAFTVQFGGPTNSKYSIDFGDGSNQAFAPNANKSATFKHVYKSPGTQLLVINDLGNDNKVLCRLTIKISEPEVTEATLSLNPNPANIGEAVTATLGNLNPTFAHSLDWGDGTVVTATGSPKHSYSTPGVYLVKLQGNKQVPVTASLRVNANAMTLSLDPNPASVGQVVTATLGNLIAGAAASLDWGDGSVVPATGSPKHSYASPGVYLVKLSVGATTFSVPPVTVSLRVTALPLELDVNPNPAEVGQQVTATTGKLLPGVAYTLDWGDGSTVPASGSQKHVYAAPGTYLVRLSASEQPPVTVGLSVRAPKPDLSLDPNPAEVDESVTASMDNLIGSLNYSLDWGDGSVVPVKGSGKASAKHVYAAPGVYVVTLGAEGLAPVTVSLMVKLPVPELSLDPNPAEVQQTVTASLGRLVGGTKYTLDWGEGAPVPISALKAASLSSASATHKYAAPGVYLVKLTPDGAPPVVVSLNVKVPKPTLDAEPNPARVGMAVTATPGNTVPGLSYTLDWGDGSVVPATGVLKHVYAAAGTYILKLSVDGAPPALFTLKVEAGLDVTELRLHFTAPEDATTLSVIAGQRLDAALDLDYAGQGSLSGDVLLDGKVIAKAVLNAVKGKTNVTFAIPSLATSEIGVHTLQYQPDVVVGAAPIQSTPPAITYTVKPVPTELEIDGFVFKITSLKNPSFSAFEGAATHSLVVAGVEAFKDMKVSFSKLTVVAVSDERVRVTGGEIVMNLNASPASNPLSGKGGFKWYGAQALPLPAGLGGFKVLPAQVLFTPTSADLSGQISLATDCSEPVSSGPNFKDYGQAILQSHPTILDIVSFNANPILDPDYATIQNINLKGLLDKGALPVIAAPMTIGGNGPIARPMSTRRVMAQGTGAAFSAANGMGHSQDFRFSGLQGRAASATAVNTTGAYAALFKYCRPDEKYTYPVTAALKPITGDLYGSSEVSLSALKVPGTPLDLGGSATLTLDLSAAQTAPGVDGVLPLYDSAPTIPKPTAGGAWMGVLLDKANAGIGQARTAPLSATLRSGYTFGADLGPGEFTDRGWTFKLKDLKLQVIENHVQKSAGSATTKVPLFEQQADVDISVQAEGDFHYTLIGDLQRDFGKSNMTSGGGAWVERGSALDLQLSAATWDLKALSTLKANATGGGSGGGITGGIKYSVFADTAAIKTYLGNVPDTKGGYAVSSAISTSVSMNSTALLAGALGTGAGSGSAGGGSGSAQFVTPIGAVNLGGAASAVLILPSASLDKGVASLGTLTFTADGNVRFGESGLAPGNQRKSADGLSSATLTSPDFKLLGQTFNIEAVVIGGAGGGYTLGLDGKQQLSSVTPTTKAQMRYKVSGGKNLSLSLRTDGFDKRVDPNAIFRVEGSDIFLALSGTAMYPASDVRASLGSVSDVKVGLKEVPGGYELTVKGGLDTGQGASVIAVSAEALFGLTSDPYFYVKASVDSRSPIVTVLGAFNLYGFTGGVAYNMKWPDNASVPQYALAPVKSGDHRLQIIGGITAAFEQGNSLHLKAIFKIDTSRGFELTADGWIMTPMNQGVFGGKAAQARILASITADGFDMRGCLGPQSMDGLNCGDLRKFTLAEVVDITAWMHVRIADQKFVKIGTYGNPISAKLNIPVLGGVESRGYLIVGQAFENGDRKNNLKGTGIFAGYAFDVNLGAAGSLGRIGWPFSCYPWARARFQYGWNIDVGLELDPVSFDAAAAFHAGFEIRAGCAGRDRPFANKAEIMAWNGKSIGLEIDADISGHLRAFNPIAFDGEANLHVDLPIIPTFNVHASVSF